MKEWQATMDYIGKLTVKQGSKLRVVTVDERVAEVRAI